VSSDQGIARELSLGEVVSKTFDLYRRNFAKYFVLYVVVEAVVGLVSTVAYGAFVLPALPTGATSQQVVNWFPGFVRTLAELIVVVGVVALVVGTIAFGGTVKMASEEIENRPVDLGAAVRFAVTKMLWMWVLGLILGIIIGLGLIALIVPGIILGIMFVVAFQALLIENAGVTGSLGRSRELVSHRWGKTFATFLVIGIILLVAELFVSLISSPFGSASRLVSDVLSAFYQPILPVATTVYFYSNRARTSSVQPGQAQMGPTVMPASGMKFCTNCGTQMAASAIFCPQCGARQPV
jgi:zinc-ribbon domain